jgi:four helix bundle protein
MKDEITHITPGPINLAVRTKRFALRIIKLSSALPRTNSAQVIGKQVLRSGTSVGAHYRESRRSRSNAEFISKLEVALQELDETQYWLELLVESEIVSESKLKDLQTEANELVAILTTCVKNVKRKAMSVA